MHQHGEIVAVLVLLPVKTLQNQDLHLLYSI